MHSKFEAYDDNGVFETGSKEECLQNIISWCESEAAEPIYTENELIEIINFFSRKHDDESEISFRGFTVKEVV